MKVNFNKINQFIEDETLQGISYKGYHLKKILNILFKALELQIEDINNLESVTDNDDKAIKELLRELPKTWFYNRDQLKENLITIINRETNEEKLITLLNQLSK